MINLTEEQFNKEYQPISTGYEGYVFSSKDKNQLLKALSFKEEMIWVLNGTKLTPYHEGKSYGDGLVVTTKPHLEEFISVDYDSATPC